MEQYHELLKRILGYGDVMYEPRTEEFTLGLAGWQSIYDLREGFPLVTTKNVPPRLPFEELFWKLRGERSVKSLVDRNIHIWTANAFDRHLRGMGLEKRIPKHSQKWNEEFKLYQERIKDDPEFADRGDLGPVYGYQWRHWRKKNGEEVDQLENLLRNIRERPGSRYHVLSSWNVEDLPEMALGPCPMIHQFSIFGKNLDLNMYQRSCDVFLGVPFNIAQDSLLTHMVADETGFNPRFFIHSYGNVHAYLGVFPRSDFWKREKNFLGFQKRFREIEKQDRQKYLDLKQWYLENASLESQGNERKDHIPFILEQLSKQPKNLPNLEIIGGASLLNAINFPVEEHVQIKNYNPYKWDSKAEMAA